MGLDLDSLKKHLDKFAIQSSLTFIREIGNLADKYSDEKKSSVEGFQRELDELCGRNIGKTSSEVLAECGMRLPEPVEPSSEPTLISEAIRNELIEVERKIEEFKAKVKSQEAESNSQTGT